MTAQQGVEKMEQIISRRRKTYNAVMVLAAIAALILVVIYQVSGASTSATAARVAAGVCLGALLTKLADFHMFLYPALAELRRRL